MFVCPAFRSDRKLVIDEYVIDWLNTLKVDHLLNSYQAQTRLTSVTFCKKIIFVFINLIVCTYHVMSSMLSWCFLFLSYIKILTRWLLNVFITIGLIQGPPGSSRQWVKLISRIFSLIRYSNNNLPVSVYCLFQLLPLF